jgi:hypothetical protein
MDDYPVLGQRPLVPLFLLGPPFFRLFFGGRPPLNQDDRNLLAIAMAYVMDNNPWKPSS